ncbi:MAG: response regulator, partial [Planctomycetota bacterium]
MSTSTTGTTTGSTGTAATPGRVVNRVLVIDDEPNHAEITAEILERDGHTCKVVTTGQAGLRQLREARWDLIITDLKMKDVDGMQILDTSRELLPDAEVILVTAHGTVDAAVKAMERGAFSFITKPVNMDELRS